MAAERYDAIINGAGQAGGPLAGAFARTGRKTALIERTHVGGTCINEGCTPTKTMVASARLAYLARRAAEYGVEVLMGEPASAIQRRWPCGSTTAAQRAVCRPDLYQHRGAARAPESARSRSRASIDSILIMELDSVPDHLLIGGG
jgi:hypothetical protein